MSDKNEILFDIEEQLSTGEELVRETRSSHVKDLPPLFQSIVKQLGLGGSAKILTPVTQAHAASASRRAPFRSSRSSWPASSRLNSLPTQWLATCPQQDAASLWMTILDAPTPPGLGRFRVSEASRLLT